MHFSEKWNSGTPMLLHAHASNLCALGADAHSSIRLYLSSTQELRFHVLCHVETCCWSRKFLQRHIQQYLQKHMYMAPKSVVLVAALKASERSASAPAIKADAEQRLQSTQVKLSGDGFCLHSVFISWHRSRTDLCAAMLAMYVLT